MNNEVLEVLEMLGQITSKINESVDKKIDYIEHNIKNISNELEEITKLITQYDFSDMRKIIAIKEQLVELTDRIKEEKVNLDSIEVMGSL